jgi:hypothetical protein
MSISQMMPAMSCPHIYEYPAYGDQPYMAAGGEHCPSPVGIAVTISNPGELISTDAAHHHRET